jgi:disulfide bond formation protein DsbB
MITYLYWALVIGLIIAAVFIIGVKMNNRNAAIISAAVILISAWAAYYFHFQQIFVKRWGGVMTISVPAGQHHMGATWKDENLWIENYDPEKNTCHFSEYSKGNLLQGRVTIKNCNPLMPQ